MRRRLLIPAATATLSAVLVTTALARSSPDGPRPIGREGGTFRVSLWSQLFDSVDPARASPQFITWVIVDTTCARLMAHPDKPAPVGSRLVPEVARTAPRVSRDFRTFTFILRRGFRFSNGTPVEARAFARAIDRILAPAMSSPTAQYLREIVGADAVLAGKASHTQGVVARGNRLTIRLTRAVPDFPARTTLVCAVPPTLPVDPEGFATIPGAGPYYVAEYRPRERVILTRNRFYGGTRPHHVDGFAVDLTVASREEALDRVERGQADWSGGAPPPVFLDPARGLVAKYGVNRSRFFVKPGLIFRQWALNTSRPLFRNNPRLRRAVNFAIDRAAQLDALGGPHATHLTDQYLPRSLPGFRDVRVYPLRRPDLPRALELAREHTRSGQAVLYTRDNPAGLALAQLVKRDLARIGLEVEVKQMSPAALTERLLRPGEPWDIGFTFFSPAYPDPYAYLNTQFDQRFIGEAPASNVTRFASPKYNRLLRRAARLEGRAREEAYGELDTQLVRDAAPTIAVGWQTNLTLFSARVGCVIWRPGFDLTAVCLR
jgi:peptide/nickel transport system substrate-binding protein